MLLGTAQLVNNGVNHLGNAGHERLLREPHPWIVKDPGRSVPVRHDDMDSISHGDATAFPRHFGESDVRPKERDDQ